MVCAKSRVLGSVVQNASGDPKPSTSERQDEQRDERKRGEGRAQSLSHSVTHTRERGESNRREQRPSDCPSRGCGEQERAAMAERLKREGRRETGVAEGGTGHRADAQASVECCE